MANPFQQLSPYTSIIGFLIGFPTAVATYYQALKTEFVSGDGECINLVTLETLHSFPERVT
jgi:hypothetical protein